jgi:hypothetical protein
MKIKFLALALVGPLAIAACNVKRDSNVTQLPSGVEVDGQGYMCTNQQTGDRFYTSDLAECTKSVTSYRCTIDDNWFIDTVDQAECAVKQKEHLATKNAEFNLDSYKEDYRNALSNLEQKTR